MQEPLTTRQVADEISDNPLVDGTVEEWQVRRLFEDATLPEPPKFGGKRMIYREQIPVLVEALRGRGWLSPAKSFLGTQAVSHQEAHPEEGQDDALPA